MNKFDTYTKTLRELILEDSKFIIPTYQRPYVWSDVEILKFLEDIEHAIIHNADNYFVGNIYVIQDETQNEDNIFDIVDGQQRFITFWLIAVAFRMKGLNTPLDLFLQKGDRLRLGFSIRKQVESCLNGLLTNNSLNYKEGDFNDEFIHYIIQGIKTISGFLEQKKDSNKIADFLNEKVVFVYNVAPKNTDLNSLFTALGSSGVQLEQTDILKSRLLKNTDNKLIYSKIWEVCENLGDYFENNVLNIFSAADRSRVSINSFKKYDASLFLLKDLEKVTDKKVTGKLISEIVEDKSENIKMRNKVGQNQRPESKCESIIPFSVLLLHTYRIFRKKNNKADFLHSFDKKNLLSIFNDLTLQQNIGDFFELLWQIRFLFDKHIVKWVLDESDESSDERKKLRLADVSEVENSFIRQNSANSEIVTLQSVLYYTGSYNQQYWLTPYLYYLLEIPHDDKSVLNELERIDNLMLPGEKKNISWQLMDSMMEHGNINDVLKIMGTNLGTKFNHYWFYKLEYLLWKKWDRKDPKFQKYRIISKTSIEHVFPQNHEFGELLDNSSDLNWIDDFGNLGLLSVGQNSSYSNKSVVKKKDDFDNKPTSTYDSLKLAKIYSSGNISKWNISDIEGHRDEMLSLLSDHYRNGKKERDTSDTHAKSEKEKEAMVMPKLKEIIRQKTASELGLSVYVIETAENLGRTDTGFKFYKEGWKYCIYFYFGKNSDLQVGIDDLRYEDPCDKDTKGIIKEGFLDFLNNETRLKDWDIWGVRFSPWSITWDEVLEKHLMISKIGAKRY